MKRMATMRTKASTDNTIMIVRYSRSSQLLNDDGCAVTAVVLGVSVVMYGAKEKIIAW